MRHDVAMPIVTYHLVEGQHDPQRVADLLRRSSHFFAEVLECPVDRVRAYAQQHPADRACVAGEMVSDGAPEAPFFQFVLLEGRPVEQRQRLLAGFTDLVVEVLGSDRSLVRGGIWTVAPEDWAIGGVPAASVRQAEVEARRNAASH